MRLRTIWTMPTFTLRERVNRTQEWFWMKLAHRLPRKLALLVVYRHRHAVHGARRSGAGGSLHRDTATNRGMTVSNDPLPVSSEARFDLMPGITPEHRDLGYCNCHPAEKGFDADCGLPQHRAEHKRRSEQHEQVMKVEKVLDATRDDTPRKSDVQPSAGQKLPDQTVNSVEELHASLRAIIPPDVHELGPDPFVNGYRQGILVAMQAAGHRRRSTDAVHRSIHR